MPAAAALVRLDAVSKAYRAGEATTRVLHDVSLQLARGETTSLVGVSGSGKSTLLSLIAGLIRPDAGAIAFDGARLEDLDDTARARLRARRIGVVLQKDNLIGFLTAAENVELAIDLAGGDRAARRARALLASVGLADRADRLPRRLSGGEAQRVAVAMALANEPDLLLADEVTGQLDADTADEVMEVILGAWRERGLTVLFVTHSGELAERAQRRLRLVDGAVLAA
ncbi:MAG: putative transport system ATP-binding protein [Solirubrobacteraceae bacterium]|nr:putative transport system ATP-binding protein [Solirubrobacteraceae bacterium]